MKFKSLIGGIPMSKVYSTFLIVLIFNVTFLFGLATAQTITSDSIAPKASNINFDDYYLYKTIALTKTHFNFDGKAELWLDKRLAKRKDPSSRYGENTIDTTEPEETDFLMAVLKISKNNSKETDRKILQRAFPASRIWV